MGVDAVPPLSASEAGAVSVALTQAGVSIAEGPTAYSSAWRGAAVRESVERRPEARGVELDAFAAEYAWRNARVVEP